MKTAHTDGPRLDVKHRGVQRLRAYALGFHARTVILFTLTA